MASITCAVCRHAVGDTERFILPRSRDTRVYCSEACLVASEETRRRARASFRRRWLSRVVAVALVLGGGRAAWHRFHAPTVQSISFETGEVRPAAPAPPEPIYYGPAWPPTDDDWLAAFARTAWAYPLPGPLRRTPAISDRIFAGRASAGHRPPMCRAAGRCGVDLGGGLWGEHVYAAHDGVVDHVQRGVGDERGAVYVRLAHFGGMAFTHYVHLAAIPRRIARGVQVKAGDVIGLVGEAGGDSPEPAVHFALSVRPSAAFPEVFWDPTPLMARWPLRLPSHGTVAGFLPSEGDLLPAPFHHHTR